MSSPEISEDDDSFEQPRRSSRVNKAQKQVISLCSDDEDEDSEATVDYTVSSDEDLPQVSVKKTNLEKRDNVIKNLFAKKDKPRYKGHLQDEPSTSVSNPVKPAIPSHKKMIGGVQVDFPVPPYGAQIALMSKVIEGINKGLNCLLESPTGSGKTLALLCGALAWQRQEKNRISDFEHQQSLVQHPELSAFGCDIASPSNHTPEKIFSKTNFGAKSIYDNPAQKGSNEESPTCKDKRQERKTDWLMDISPDQSQVTIHKRRKVDGSPSGNTNAGSSMSCTPEKPISVEQPGTPKHVRVPKIYYGARTHKQIQQVVKEFARTSYCGEMKMTVLSSRDYSCIRPFDRNIYSNKNDMCKECVKKVKVPKASEVQSPTKQSTNCKYYENRQAFTHESMPPAFDLEDLVNAGHDMGACPYYGARQMAIGANIVFCPYNYLIDPGIRASMQIEIRDEIVILDEAHNIEDICRDAATYTITREQLDAAIKELEYITGLKYTNQEIGADLIALLNALKSIDDWFVHQIPLVKNQPINNNEAVYVWQVQHFITTLNNHNIGVHQYQDFRNSAEVFSYKWREDPSTLYGVTQVTASLIEVISLVFGYLFRDDCKHTEDFVPALIRTVSTHTDNEPDPAGWRSTLGDKTSSKESLSLRMMCMNPGVVFSALLAARCVILSSGTLTPLTSLHSELGAKFPLQVSPGHVIPMDRVWIGSLTTGPNGRPIECKSTSTNQVECQDAIGSAVRLVCDVTPHGVLVFLPSYTLMFKLMSRWKETGLWRKLSDMKHVFMESRNVTDHSSIMDDYYKYSATAHGALLFAVYRGKVSEGMDFKDHQARAVITVGIPYPNTFDMMVKQKMRYNDRHANSRQLLSGSEWLRVQAYRALNQAVGRCVRHRGDWGAVLLLDARFNQQYYTEHLSKWVRNFLGNNHCTFEALSNGCNSLKDFMQAMTLSEKENL